MTDTVGDYASVTFPSAKSQYWCMSFSHIFIFSCFLVFCPCALVHISTLHVLSFQNPIYCYPYYSFVYNEGFYLTEYKLAFSSSQSLSKLHCTHSCLIVVSSYSLRIIVKVLTLVILHRLSLSLVVSHHRHIPTISRSRLRRTGDLALYPHFATHCVSVCR